MINRKYKVNEHYFDAIDHQNKAYLLGLLYSDGNMYDVAGEAHIVTFAQLSDREELVMFFKNELESDRPISYQIKQLKNGELHKLAYFKVNSEIICKALQKLGLCNKKSLILTWPSDKIPEQYMSHFIRGLFDGDGCVWNGKRKRCG